MLPVLPEMWGPQNSPLEGEERASGQKSTLPWVGVGVWVGVLAAHAGWEGASVGPAVRAGARGGARGAGAAGPASSARCSAGCWEVPRAAVEAGVRADPGSRSATGSPGSSLAGPDGSGVSFWEHRLWESTQRSLASAESKSLLCMGREGKASVLPY